MSPEETAARFDNRAGYCLVAYGEVGLPLYRLTTVGLCVEKRSLDPIEEFVLRSILTVGGRVADVAGVLGLDVAVVESCLVDLIRTDCVRLCAGGAGTQSRIVELTPKGRDVALEQEIAGPVEQTVVFCVDGLTRVPRLYAAESLRKPRDLKEEGLPEVRAFPARAPSLEEINIRDVIEVVRLDAGRAESPRQLLRINSVERRDRVFLTAVALAYRMESGGGLQVAFAIDGRLSVEHEAAFARVRGAEKTKLFCGLQERVVRPSMTEVLGAELSGRVEEATGSAVDGAPAGLGATASAAGGRVSIGEGKADSRGERRTGSGGNDAEAAREQVKVRALAVYEHPPLLSRALEKARERLLVISPWIRRAVVTKGFVERVRGALARGVRVYVGYGLGDDDSGEREWDREARGELEALATEGQGFVLKRLGDTHAKVLIVDREFFVISSFNWLSFRGDRNQAFREEWGTLVSVPGVVDEYFERMVQRFG